MLVMLVVLLMTMGIATNLMDISREAIGKLTSAVPIWVMVTVIAIVIVIEILQVMMRG